jgi:hypothetical protein
MMTVMQGFYGGLDNMGWCLKIWLADSQINDISPFACKGFGTRKNLERGFSTEPVHLFRKLKHYAISCERSSTLNHTFKFRLINTL